MLPKSITCSEEWYKFPFKNKFREGNIFYNTFPILNDVIHIITTAFGYSGLYGSIYQARCIGNNIYTDPRIVKRGNYTPIRGPVLKNDINFHCKIYSCLRKLLTISQ